MLRLMRYLLVFAFAAHGGDVLQQMQQNQMSSMTTSRLPPPTKMRVYLKGNATPPPLDSFRLASGSYLLWRYEKEDALVFKGDQIRYRADEIDSVVTEKGFKGVPHGKFLVFLQAKGPINFYTLEPGSSAGMPFLIQREDGDLLRPNGKVIRGMIGDDQEAMNLISRYNHRYLWKAAIVAVGLGLSATGATIYNNSRKEDENGNRKQGSPLGATMMVGGLVVAVAPLTGILNFIWNDLPREALSTYNRNQSR